MTHPVLLELDSRTGKWKNWHHHSDAASPLLTILSHLRIHGFSGSIKFVSKWIEFKNWTFPESKKVLTWGQRRIPSWSFPGQTSGRPRRNPIWEPLFPRLDESGSDLHWSGLYTLAMKRLSTKQEWAPKEWTTRFAIFPQKLNFAKMHIFPFTMSIFSTFLLHLEGLQESPKMVDTASAAQMSTYIIASVIEGKQDR